MSSRADLDEDESANQPLSVQEHISQDGSSDDLSDNETFNKKGGTTNVGHEYEDLQVAKIIIKLLKHKNISNFKIWSNDENFGKFDDVILKFLTTNKKVYRFAIQVKHSESKKKLSNQVLAGLTGDDHSINVYFQDYRQFKKDAQIIQDNFKLILLTSKTTYAIWEEEFKFGEDFTLKANPVRDPFALVTGNQNLGTAFQFSIQKVHTGDDQLHKDFEEFLEKFYLYPYQDHVKKTKFLVAEEFNELFKTNTSHKFLDFIKNWSEMTGNKRKLSKSFISDKVSELLLSAFIVQPNLSPPDIECEENEKKLLKAISQFDRTFIEATDFNEANPNYNKYPSIVSVTQANVGTVSKALELIDAEKKEKKKIIFMGASKDFNGLSHLPDVELFRNLNDLKAKDETLYQEIATTFTLSLQGKQTIALSKILYDDRSRQNITPSHLLRMLEGHLLIGGPAEELPKYYIPLSMSDMLIDCDFIIDVDAVPSMNAKVLVACRDISKFVDEYKDLQYIEMDEEFDIEMSQINVHVCKEHLAKKCFQTLSKLNSSFNCHLFEYRENEHALKWLESTDAVNHLRRYLKQEYAISENDVSKESYKINIICDEPGMGKSWFLDKLKNIYDPTYRVIRIEPKTHAIFRCQLSDQELDNYLKNVDCNVKTEMEKFLLKYLYDNGRFVILWDALDEVSYEKLPHVLDAIKYFKGKGIQQWLTSRNVLREKLEVTFVVLARNIVKFDENQQKSYMKRRLKDCYPTNCIDIAENIMNNLKSYSVNELLGIPIQISIVTELFMGPDSKLILEKLNKVDPPNSNQTFRIRPGTIDLGMYYECLCLSHTIIRLLSNREVVDFQAWTNDAQFGYFDDIIVDVHMQDGSHNKFAMQLKHSDSRRNMPFRKADFESVTGMLCVNRFFQSFRKCRLVLDDCTLIIQTNRKGPENWNETITFENKVMLKIHQADEDPMATSIGPSRNRPFKFSIVSYLPETEQKLLEDLNDFLSRFYLYVQQPDVSEIENLINTDFNQLFATSENAWKTFVDFIREWSKIRGRKLKLTRNFMCSKVIEQLLRPFISVFSSQRASSNPKRDLLKNAVLQFHKTWVDTQNTADLEKLTSGIQAETLLDEMIQLNKKFLITSSYFRDLTDLDQKDISIFLWYLNQFPLVVSITPDNINIVRKVFELNVEGQEQGKNFVLVGSKELCEGLISSDDFRSLHDLWIKDQNLYEEITANFTASLVRRSPVPLKSIVNDAIKKCIPPSHLLQMLDGPMTIGEISRETIPYYDEPYFTDFIIDGSFLTTEISDTVILIICENPAGIKSKFCDASFAEFNKGTEEDKHLSSRIWLLPSTDYCESAFHKLNKLNKKYHLLEFIEQDGDLKWMKSNKNMDDLRHYLCKNRKPIPENEVLKTNRPINIIYEETGIYKSRLSTILEKSNKELFEVIEIDVSKDPFFKNTKNPRTPKELNDYLTNTGCSASKSDIELVIALRKYYFLNKNVIIVWDVLEELFFVDLLNVFDTIKHYTTVTAHQWIITKSRFVEVFENRLHVLSRSILPLDEHQQITYLDKRLSQKYTGTVLNEVVGKMMAYLKSNEISRKMSADIQQMFLLTERILNDDSVMNVIL